MIYKLLADSTESVILAASEVEKAGGKIIAVYDDNSLFFEIESGKDLVAVKLHGWRMSKYRSPFRSGLDSFHFRSVATRGN